MAAEGLLEPPRRLVGDDLGVDEQWRRRVARRASVARTSRSPTVRTVTASKPMPRAIAAMSVSGNTTVREVVAVRAEVVHLGAVAVVVVDDDDHRQPEPDDGVELADAHQRAAVAERGDRQAVGRARAAPIVVARPRPIDWNAWVMQ